MLKNYFTVAIRNFWRNKVFSFINVIGLSIGISAAIVIYLIVHYEFSFDKFEKDGDRIYRVVLDMKLAGTPLSFSGVPAPMPDAARNEITGLESVVGFHQTIGDPNVSINTNNNPHVYKKQRGIIFADNNYFNLVPYQWIAGSAKSLNEPYKVILTEERAKAYFPGVNYNDIIGKRVVYNDSIITSVTGIVKNLSQNSDFVFKEFISHVTIPSSGLKTSYAWEQWGSSNDVSRMLVKLAPGTTKKDVDARLNQLVRKYQKDNDGAYSFTFHLQPFAEMHFDKVYGTFGDHSANKSTLYGLLAVAAFLLLLGCINFINLTTAQATQRAKEIGIRKTMGSSRLQLMLQFLHETFFITALATILSIALVPLLLKTFNNFIPGDVHFNLLQQPGIIVFLLALVLLVSFLSGFYPALVLSKYNPVSVLKNQVSTGTGGTRKAFVRKSLTVSQFLIAQVFIMATLIASKQISYVLNKDMGFKKDAIIYFDVPFSYYNIFHPDPKRFVLLKDLKAIPGVELVSLATTTPSSYGWNIESLVYNDGKKEIKTDVRTKGADTNYLQLYHIKLLAGRNIQESDTSREYVINETYMHVLGFQHPKDVLNKQIGDRPVVGVMADFNQQSLHEPVKPLLVEANDKFSSTFHIALKPQGANPGSWKTTIAQVQAAYKKLYPDEDFSYNFFDESIASYYKAEQDMAGLLKWATGLAVFISCIGLLGLVIYTTNVRTKEIGVRKVLGASVANIVTILSKDFLLVVAIAFAIATPVAWIAMNKWLNNFAYRTTMSWWLFAASGLLLIAVALITLSFQVVRAANANPVKSLRSE
ncbi:MAG: ABC transporter permease [Chitinophagaceae bacterium]